MAARVWCHVYAEVPEGLPDSSEGRLMLLISLVTKGLGSGWTFLSDGKQDSQSGLKRCTRVQGRQLEGAVITSSVLTASGPEFRLWGLSNGYTPPWGADLGS